MRGIPGTAFFVIVAFFLFMHVVSYWGLRMILRKIDKSLLTKISTAIFGVFSVGVLSVLVFSFSSPEILRTTQNYSYFYVVISLIFLDMVPITIFALFVLGSLLCRMFRRSNLSYKMIAGGLLLSFGIFVIILSGIFIGRKTIRVVPVTIQLKDLPEQMDGMTIAQISDIHLGSYSGDKSVIESTVRKIQEINPDLFVFTGDIVNNFCREITGYEKLLSQLSGKYGKFAILGNHDYGDYFQWPDSLQKIQNLHNIEIKLREAGFKLLLNQSVKVDVKDTCFYLLGVENWGHPPFPQYARLSEAINGVPASAFTILLSHDPAFWEAEIVPSTNIPLTLSGHTHAAQSGIILGGIEFSIMYLIQKYWGGLYQKGNQFLYVNRGLGTVGFVGRIDMRPEITLITLKQLRTH